VDALIGIAVVAVAVVFGALGMLVKRRETRVDPTRSELLTDNVEGDRNFPGGPRF
jgi:hypothetical protein